MPRGIGQIAKGTEVPTSVPQLGVVTPGLPSKPVGEQLLTRLLLGQLQRLLEQGQRPRGTVVDTKATGRPEKLGGMLEDTSRSWQQWNYRLELWLTSQFPETRDILTWARTQDDEITAAALRAQMVTGVTPEKVQEFNRQLETWNHDGGYSRGYHYEFQPWLWGGYVSQASRLQSRLHATDMVTSFKWLWALVSTKAVPDGKQKNLIPAIERCEDQHRRYAARRDCTALTERQKMVSLLGLVPNELQNHLELNLPRLSTSQLLRREIVTFAENRRAADDSGAGHLLKDCWQNKGKEYPRKRQRWKRCGSRR